MAEIGVMWTDERRVALQMDFPVGWTWDDLYHVESLVHARLGTVPHTVDLVYKIPEGQPLPKNHFRHIRNLANRYPKNTGLVIWTGCNRLTIELIRNVARSYPDLARRYAFADDMPEAMGYVGP